MCLQPCGQHVISSPHRVSLLFVLLGNMRDLGVEWSWTPLWPLSHSPSLSFHRPSTADSYFSVSHLHKTKTLLVASTSMGTEAGTLNQQVILVSTKNTWFGFPSCDVMGIQEKRVSAELMHASGWRATIHFWFTNWCISCPMGQALLIVGLKRAKVRPVKGWLQYSQPLHFNTTAAEIIQFSDEHFRFHPGWKTSVDIKNSVVYINMHSSFFETVGKTILWTLHPSFPFHPSPDMHPSLAKSLAKCWQTALDVNSLFRQQKHWTESDRNCCTGVALEMLVSWKAGERKWMSGLCKKSLRPSVS